MTHHDTPPHPRPRVQHLMSKDTISNLLAAHWFKIAAVIFAAGGYVALLKKADSDNVPRSEFVEYQIEQTKQQNEKDLKEALFRATLQNTLNRIEESMADMRSAVCAGKPQTMGCRR